MEKQISIIIPTYNMEKYIGKCLDSLLIPEFDQVEVLVVNDGSKDRSSEIAHEYAERYPNSIRVIDKENGNYGSCINAALPQCTGRYVKILDADDTFDTAAFSEFVNLIYSINDDVILSGFVRINEFEKVLSTNIPSLHNIKFNETVQLFDKKTILSKYVPMHEITYSKRIFDRFTYIQIEGISYSDAIWSIVPLAYCRTIYCSQIILYRYLLGREGQTSDPVQVAKSISHHFKVLGELTNFLCKFIGDDNSADYLFQSVLNCHRSTYLTGLNHWTPETRDLLMSHEKNLSLINPKLFEKVGALSYTPKIGYKIFKNLRSNNYSINFKIPFLQKIRISVAIRLNPNAGKLWI